MRFEDMGKVWREEPTGEYRRLRIEELSNAHGRAARHLDHMARLGLRAFGAILLVTVPLFAWSATRAPRPLLAWPGAALIWGWLLWGLLFWWRLGTARPDPGLPVRNAVAAELARLRMLEGFRRRIPWSLPLFVVGELLLFVGLSPAPRAELPGTVVFAATVLIVAFLGFRGNLRRLEKTVRPLRGELESWCADLEDFDTRGGGSS